MEEIMTGAELQGVLNNVKHGSIDVGDKPEVFRLAIKELRDAGVTILVGPRLNGSDGRVSQWIGYGQSQSTKASVEL